MRRPGAGPSGVSTVTSPGRHIAQRLGGEQHADARRGATEMLPASCVLSRSDDERVVHERMIDEVDRHGVTIHGTGSGLRDWQGRSVQHGRLS